MKREQGFTLTELLVVIGIFTVLLGMSAAALIPMSRQFRTLDSPSYRGAKMVENAFKQARQLAMQTGVPHSVAFNRPAASGNRFQSNFSPNADAAPDGDNFFLIIRHQIKTKTNGATGDWTGDWHSDIVNPWEGWLLAARTSTPSDLTSDLLDDFSVTTIENGRLPAASGFHAFAAGIPSVEHHGSSNYRIWYWSWDDRINSQGGASGAMGQESGAMIRNGEEVRVFIDASGEQSAHSGTDPSTNPALAGGLQGYARNDYPALPLPAPAPNNIYPYALGARVTFLPTGEVIAYVGGRPAVLPNGPYTPPFNFTLTPNGFHIVAISEANTNAGHITSASNLRTIADNFQGSGNSFDEDAVYAYFVGINQFTGETFVKNRLEMLEWADEFFPCPHQKAEAVEFHKGLDGDNATKRARCLSDCAASNGYMQGAQNYVANASNSYLRTRHNTSSIACCQDQACQWRAAVRIDANY